MIQQYIKAKVSKAVTAGIIRPEDTAMAVRILMADAKRTGQVHGFCDCGRVAYKKDGSGWFCRDCERVVVAMQKMLDELIVRRRNELAFINGERTQMLTQAKQRYNRAYWLSHRGALVTRRERWRMVK